MPGPVPSHSRCAAPQRACLGALCGHVCVSRVCVCRGPRHRVAWAMWASDLTQGMPAVEGGDCGGQVGQGVQAWGSPGGGNMRESSVMAGICGLCLWASFTPCHLQLRATTCQWGFRRTGQPSITSLCTVRSGRSGA